MDEEREVRAALGGLATDEPPPGFSTRTLLAAGRRTRRRRGLLAAGGASLAVAGVVAAAIAVPAALGSNAADRQQAGSPAVTPSSAVVNVTPSGSRHPVPVKPNVSPGTSCTGPTDQQWNTHRAYDAAVRAVLPSLPGTLSDDYVRGREMCGLGSYRTTSWSLVVNNRAGQLGVTRTDMPGQYQQWSLRSPCANQRNCQVSRHGTAIVMVLRRDEGADAHDIEVVVTWPDDSVVDASSLASAPATGRPPLAAPPLNQAQLVALALNSAVHGI